jgi:hypothetical protein
MVELLVRLKMGCGKRAYESAARGAPAWRGRGRRGLVHAGTGRRAVVREHVLETGARAVQRAGRAQKTRIVVQRQDQPVQFEQHLLGVGVGAQVAGVHGQADGARQRRVPGPHHGRQRVAHRAGPVVEFHRAADVDAARVHLHRHTAQPALEQRTQPRLAARLLDGGEEHLFLEARVVLANDGDLQFLARTEVREDAGLAHLRDLGQRADGQALQPHVRGQAERGFQDRGACLLALVQDLGQRPRRGGGLGDGWGGQAQGTRLNTNVRSILQTSTTATPSLP